MSESDSTDLRELKTALARAVEELEEQRVAAIELRMLLDASDARLRSMTAELEEARRAADEARRLAREAEEKHESSRVEAIEMRMILDATEHRASKLEGDLASTLRDHRDRGSEADQLAAELQQIAGERRVLEGLLDDARDRLERGDRAAEELALLRGDFESQRSSLEAHLIEARQRVGELEEQAVTATRIEDVERQFEVERAAAAGYAEEIQRHHAEERAAAAARLAELESQLSALREEHGRRVEELERQQTAERAEHIRRIEELEAQQNEAAQRHSETVSRYMLELNQQGDALRTAEAELASLREEIEVARQTCTDTAAELTSLRGENEALEQLLREVDSKPPAQAATSPVAARSSALRLADAAGDEEDLDDPTISDVEAAIEVVTPARHEKRRQALPLTIVHLDDRAEYREAVEQTVSQYSRMHYVAATSLPETPMAGPCLLVVNLLSPAVDPLAALASSESFGVSEPAAFTYCGDGNRGVVLGVLDYFPEPFDADACAARLLAREESVRRLLVVSDDVELMNGIRSTMARFKGSTSGALDARQALELSSLVRPEYVLVDLGLPRGEGLRVLARLRADAKTSALPAALLWGRRIDAGDLRAHSARVARETPLAIDDFKRALQQTLNDRGFRGELLRETA